MKRKTKMVLIMVTFVLLAPTFATLVYADEKEHPHICKDMKFIEELNMELIEQKNGYQVIKIKNLEYVYINSCIEIPKNNCKNGEIALFLQQKDGGGRLFTYY